MKDSKKRPVLVIAPPGGDGSILCQIISQNRHDRYSIELTDRDFIEGGLKVDSCIRPNRIFTADTSLILYRAGRVKPDTVKKVENMPVQIGKTEMNSFFFDVYFISKWPFGCGKRGVTMVFLSFRCTFPRSLDFKSSFPKPEQSLWNLNHKPCTFPFLTRFMNGETGN